MVGEHPGRSSLRTFKRRRGLRCSRATLGILFGLLGITLNFVPGQTHAQPAASKEYQIKAAFLFNFAQFVEWPTNAFTSTDAPFSIGILGDDPFGKALDATVQGESVQNRKLTIQRSRRLEDLQNCQVIFISKSEKSRLSEILPKLNARSILTVSELPGFAGSGGVINFYLEGAKVRFEINPAVAQRERLKISSQLLNLGKIIESNPEK